MKYGYRMNSRLDREIMVEGNRRLDFKKEKMGIAPIRHLMQKTMKN